MLRKTTLMRAATVNKFVNKAEVISVKSERAKKHVLLSGIRLRLRLSLVALAAVQRFSEEQASLGLGSVLWVHQDTHVVGDRAYPEL